MSGDRSLLLDTNAVIAFFNEESAVQNLLFDASSVFLCATAIGELCYGAQKSQRVQENLERIDKILTRLPLLECGLATAQRYGIVKRRLEAKGHPIPDNDMWIAACAQEHGLTVVTNDAHFAWVEELDVLGWASED